MNKIKFNLVSFLCFVSTFSLSANATDDIQMSEVLQYGVPISIYLDLNEISSNAIDLMFTRRITMNGKCLIGNSLIPIAGTGRYTISDCYKYETISQDDEENITFNFENSYAKTYYRTQKIKVTISMPFKDSDEYKVNIDFIEGPTDKITTSRNFYLNPKFILSSTDFSAVNISDQEQVKELSEFKENITEQIEVLHDN